MAVGNEQQREGKWDQAKGTIKENVGDLTGNEELEREGEADRAMGQVREGVGDVRQGVERTAEGVRRGYENATNDEGEPDEGA